MTDLLKFQKGSSSPIRYPLCHIPDEPSKIVSPIVYDEDVHPVGPNFLVPPVEFGEGERASLNEVACVRSDVSSGIFPQWFIAKHLPACLKPWRDPECLVRHWGSCSNPQQIAEAVHRDPTPQLANIQMKWLDEIGVKMRPEIHADLHSEFVNHHVMLQALAGVAPYLVSPSIFAAKWFYGAARPEERVAVPGHNAAAFTSYPEGCPNHPRYPAMHGGVAGTWVWIPAVYEIDQNSDIWEDLARASFLWSFGRTFAGVHDAEDNLAGLQMGQELVYRLMPKVIEDLVGVSKCFTSQIMAHCRIDWGQERV